MVTNISDIDNNNLHKNDGRISVAVYGASGSVGSTSIDLIACNRRLFNVITFVTYGSNPNKTLEQIRLIKPNNVCLINDKSYEFFANEMNNFAEDSVCNLFCGIESAIHLANQSYDISIIASSGIETLSYAIRACRYSSIVAIANKESIACTGDLLPFIAEYYGNLLIPLDSEHSSIFRILEAYRANSDRDNANYINECKSDKLNPELRSRCNEWNYNTMKNLYERREWRIRYPDVAKIILTCSGGALRDMNRDDMMNANLEDVLRHPNWNMGQKITVDSATLVNKGLEIIEAMNLFGIPIDVVSAVIHRESSIHAIVEDIDGSIMMHASKSSMHIPVSYALRYALNMSIKRHDMTGDINILYDNCNHYSTGDDASNRNHNKEKSGYVANMLNAGKVTFSLDKIDTVRFPLFQTTLDAYRCGLLNIIIFNAVNDFYVGQFIIKSISLSDMINRIEDYCSILNGWKTENNIKDDSILTLSQSGILDLKSHRVTKYNGDFEMIIKLCEEIIGIHKEIYNRLESFA